MGRRWKRYAPLGLYLALVAMLVSAGLFIVQRAWTLAIQISLGVAVLGVAIFVLLDPQRVRDFFRSRRGRYGSNALILSLAFIGILVVVNYLVVQISTETPRRWDLTEDKAYTLSPETLAALESLEQPVQAQAFFSSNLSTQAAQDLLAQYQVFSNGNFTYEFIDPLADPLTAEQKNVTQDGTVVLSMGEDQQNVTRLSEQELTSALVRLLNPDPRAIYFLTGHGEYSPDEFGEQSLSTAKRILESKNYTVATLNLLATNQIPDDAAVIVVAGPQKPISEGEVELLRSFVSAGNALVVMEEPLPLTEMGESAQPLAEYLVQEWGITLGNDFVVDLSSDQPTLAIGSQWGSHPITLNLQGYVSIFPSARSASVEGVESGASQQILVSTSPQAWAETDLVSLSSGSTQVQADEGVDLIGPVPLGAVSENFTTDGRVVVFGDVDFASDGFILAYGNADLFINTVDWAAGEEQLISITPKDLTDRLLVPPQQPFLNLIMLASVFIIPGLALVSGLVIWFQRRKRG